MTNPELIWAHHQEQKQAARRASKARHQTQAQPQSDVMSSSASTFSGSTAYSYDKDQPQTDSKQKRSVRQRIKEAFKDMGSPPTAYEDRVNGRKTEEPAPEHGPMSSTPQSRT
ncbi:uncharacterized protein GGS22DRAFT_184879 [Annulohypoxylon maeteangense]|uniref:uncharacterized protein n=1 Tax=Annulohypoxylon maeteangense TaxID=1927788 RepID=UPI00200766F7|nr:uncharacterized protein GGS22DRAFT_184879 [Annulohypoxylon maeteangense]KAI0889301.1 hypothetical protein GGS22DRAFT_184879 [Annulohypoxylon maeteangense]